MMFHSGSRLAGGRGTGVDVGRKLLGEWGKEDGGIGHRSFVVVAELDQGSGVPLMLGEALAELPLERSRG